MRCRCYVTGPFMCRWVTACMHILECILHALQISQIGTYGRFDARPKLRNGILSIEVHHIVILSI